MIDRRRFLGSTAAAAIITALDGGPAFGIVISFMAFSYCKGTNSKSLTCAASPPAGTPVA